MNQEPIPYNDPMVTPRSGLITDEWTRYYNNVLLPQINAAPTRVETYSTGGAGSNLALPLTPLGSVQIAGQYRYAHYLQCLTPGGVSSAFQATVSWTFNGIAQTQTFSNVNGNLTTTHEGVEYPIHVDGGTPVSVAVTYASNPAAAAVYFYQATLERVEAD